MERAIRSSDVRSGKWRYFGALWKRIPKPPDHLLAVLFVVLAELSFFIWLVGGLVNCDYRREWHIAFYDGRLAILRIHSGGYRFPEEIFDHSKYLGFQIWLWGQPDPHHAPATVIIISMLPIALLFSWLAVRYVRRSGFRLGIRWRRRKEMQRGFEVIQRSAR
jgi:hypothetical protein